MPDPRITEAEQTIERYTALNNAATLDQLPPELTGQFEWKRDNGKGVTTYEHSETKGQLHVSFAEDRNGNPTTVYLTSSRPDAREVPLQEAFHRADPASYERHIAAPDREAAKEIEPGGTVPEQHLDSLRNDDTGRFIQQMKLAGSVPPQHLDKFQLEQYDYDRDIYSFRNDDTGRFIHVDSAGRFFNQEAEPISKDAAVSHALDKPPQVEQHTVRDSPELQQAL